MAVDYEAALKILEKYMVKHGFPPTRKELAKEWGLASTNTVQVRLMNMEKAGMVRWDNGRFIPTELLKKMQEVVNVKISIDRILPNPEQPRKVFDQDDLESLAASIRENGVIVPISVEEAGENKQLRMWKRLK